MVKSYRVAGHSFNIEANCDLSFWNRIEENYGPFETKEGERPLFSLSVCDSFDIPDKKAVFSNRDSVKEGFITIDIYQSGNGHYFEFTQPHSPQTNGKLLINGSQSEAKLSLHGNMLEQFNTLNTAANFCFMAATASLNTIMVHSSTIIYKGKAYMFLGKSGTGKSTHSRMWLNSIMGTELLNDDHPIIRIDESGTAVAYGSPWSGKTPCYKNLQAPVGGIVRISRAKHNRARRLSPIESYASLMPSCPNLVWERKFAEYKHSMLQKVISSAPCWVMECLPNEDAAIVCRESVTKP